MNNLLSNALNNREDLLFCYGNIVPSINKLIYSARHPFVIQTGTRYDLETTITSDLKDNVLKNYKNIFYYNSISHNFSILKINNSYIGIGGVSQPSYLVGNKLAPHCKWGKYWEGLYLLKSKDCENWTNPVKIIDRDWGLKNECCCFDSQPSLLFDTCSNIYYLYCRWNPYKQVRKLQVFTTNNLDEWKNKSIEVTVDKNINIYNANIFKYKDKFIAIVRYYYNAKNYNPNVKPTNYSIGLLISNNGINFTFLKEKLINNYNMNIHGYLTQGHIIKNNKIIYYLLMLNGNLNKYQIDIDFI